MLDDITEGGTTVSKWAAAEDAVSAVLSAYGEAAQYGLMMFPGSSGGCATGEINVEIGANKAPEILSALSAINWSASRQTPAGQSLMASSKYAGITDPAYNNYVIFLSDGWQYCSIPTGSTPVCVSAADCTLMSVDPCPSCNPCQNASSDPNCKGKPADGCFCVRKWPVLGVQALAAAGVSTYVVGFGSQVDAKTLNQAAEAGGTALTGCDPNSDSASCYYQATAPSSLNAALADIVQQVVVDSCLGPCDIPGERTCTASGWSACDAPDHVECTSACGTKGTQQCVNGTLTPCDAECPDSGAAGAGGAGGTGGASGQGGEAGVGDEGAQGGKGGEGATGGTGAVGGTGGEQTDAGLDKPKPPAPEDTGEDGGCACHTGRTAPSPIAAAFVALMAALGLRIRRRR
jgi:MYXO-CTERM domain-containing protein